MRLSAPGGAEDRFKGSRVLSSAARRRALDRISRVPSNAARLFSAPSSPQPEPFQEPEPELHQATRIVATNRGRGAKRMFRAFSFSLSPFGPHEDQKCAEPSCSVQPLR